MNNSSGIWIFIELAEKEIASASLELLAKAQDLKAHNGEIISAVVLGSGLDEVTKMLPGYGADQVITVDDPALATYSARPYQKALTSIAEKYKPSILLFSATPLGRDLAPRVMVSLKTGLTADAIDLGYDEDGVFYQTTPAYGGKIYAHIVILEQRPQMATVHPKLFSPLEYDASRNGTILEEHVELSEDEDYAVLSAEERSRTGIAIDQAKLLVSGGRGIKKPEDFEMLRELADLLGGQIASSRPPVDQGWLPHELQIGQSGTAVKPELIINVAVSGSAQYQVGMQNSGCIVSINHNPNAPIFDLSQYGVDGDYRTVVPAIIAEIKKRKA